MSQGYVYEFQGKQFTPDGQTTATDTTEHNKQQEAQEIDWLKSHPERLFLYVKMPNGLMPFESTSRAAITTWLGTEASTRCFVGRRARSGFGMHTYRRSVDCLIFGVRYVGWYMESSGNYCRLKKAKR